MIVKPSIFLNFDKLVCASSTKSGGNPNPPFYNNLSFWVNDDNKIVQKNRDLFFGKLDIVQSQLAIPQQIHSDNIQIVNSPGYFRNTDGLITKEKNIYLIVSTADCYPVMIYDKSEEIVAAVHSGWRGTQKRIVSKALSILINDLSSLPENLLIFIGPGICSEHFEVGKEVADMFDLEYVINNSGHYFINLKAVIINQIKKFYIPERNIGISCECTYHNNELLHSYRRDKEKSGRMFTVIGMK